MLHDCTVITKSDDSRHRYVFSPSFPGRLISCIIAQYSGYNGLVLSRGVFAHNVLSLDCNVYLPCYIIMGVPAFECWNVHSRILTSLRSSLKETPAQSTKMPTFATGIRKTVAN